MRPSNERHPGSERGLQRVCAAPLRQFRRQGRANYGKLSEFQDQAYPWGCLAGISRVGCRKLAYSWGSFMPQELKMLPMGTRDSALRVKMLLMGTQEKKESLDRWWPAVHQSCAQIQRFPSPFFRHWAPTPAPEPSPGLRLCRGIAAALPARN